jgi:hypothetical protein
MTKTEATRLVAILTAAYPVPSWPEETIQLYVEVLTELDYRAATDAVKRWMHTESASPAISDIFHLVADATLGMCGPAEAWGLLHRTLLTESQPPKDFPPAILEALHLTGRTWTDCRYLDFSQYPWLKRDFESAYREVRNRDLAAVQQGKLPGPSTDVRIGRDEARALLTSITRGNA